MASGLWQPAPAKVETNVVPQMANTIPGTWLTLTPTTINATSPTLEPEQASPVEATDSLFLTNSNTASTPSSSRHSSFNAIRSPMLKTAVAGPDAAERRASNVAMGRTAAFMCNNSR